MVGRRGERRRASSPEPPAPKRMKRQSEPACIVLDESDEEEDGYVAIEEAKEGDGAAEFPTQMRRSTRRTTKVFSNLSFAEKHGISKSDAILYPMYAA